MSKSKKQKQSKRVAVKPLPGSGGATRKSPLAVPGAVRLRMPKRGR